MTGGRVGVLFGPDIDPRTGALLSIAQLQAALRTGATGRLRPGAPALAGAPPARRQPPGRPVRIDAEPRTGGQGIVAAPARPGVPAWLSWLTPEPVMVVAAQPAAGCSTVAMAIAGAAADRAAHLIEVADAAASGLAAATRAELGSDPAGLWRRGRRDQVLVSRACDLVPDQAPDLDVAAAATVVDLGHPRLPLRPGALAGLPGPAVVAVCRASIPGISRLEVLLAALDRPALVAVIGPSRWAGPVRAVVGPGLRQAADAGAVVRIPCDRDLAMTGLTAHDLPRKVAAAGARLWQLATAAGTSPIQPHPRPQPIWTGEHP